MTFNAMMPPALPPTAAAGLKAADNFGPEAFKSGRLSEPGRDGRSFLDALNHATLRQSNRYQEATPEKIRAEASVVSGKETPDSRKNGHISSDSSNPAEETWEKASDGESPILDPWQAFGMIHLRFFGSPMAGDGSFSNGDYSETTVRSLIDRLAGIGAFEQLQANIAPEAGNRYIFGQLSAESALNQGFGGVMGIPAEFAGLWQWLTSAPQDSLSNPTAGSAASGDTLLGALLTPQPTIAAASGLNAETIGTNGQDTPANPGAIQFSEDFLAKMTILSLAGESDLSENINLAENTKLAENAKMVGAGKDALITLPATTDPNSETFLEAPSRQMIENSQLFKMAADIKVAAEQTVNPNFTAEGVATQPEDQGLSIKTTVLKAESLPIAELGGKITLIEGDNKDGGFLLAQDQMPEHLKTLENAMRTTEGARSGLSSQAMDQVVQKAVLLLNHNQQEAHIELKPEFLGHIRMQIVTENQQVSIKIATEFPFVKDMLESNLNQLKAELQAQGLKIDSLEVSVAHDSYAGGDDLHQKTAEIAKFRDSRDNAALDEGPSEKRMQSQSGTGDAHGETAIDYFA